MPLPFRQFPPVQGLLTGIPKHLDTGLPDISRNCQCTAPLGIVRPTNRIVRPPNSLVRIRPTTRIVRPTSRIGRPTNSPPPTPSSYCRRHGVHAWPRAQPRTNIGIRPSGCASTFVCETACLRIQDSFIRHGRTFSCCGIHSATVMSILFPRRRCYC